MRRNLMLKLKAANNYSWFELNLLTCFLTRSLWYLHLNKIMTFGDRAFSMLAIANWTYSSSKSARSISPLISSSATRSRISASSCRRVLSFCCRLSLCYFSLISCSHTWDVSYSKDIITQIIRFALDLCPACCRRFLASSSAITQHNFTHNWYVESTFIRLMMDHVDEFELYFIPRIVRHTP